MTTVSQAFRIDDLDRTAAIEEWLKAILDAGNGWAHLRPVGADEAAMLVHQSFKVKLAEQPPQLPQATLVVPKTRKRGKRKPIEIAVSHMKGQPCAHELDLPERWRIREDDPGRGLLIEVPADTEPRELVTNIAKATAALSTLEIIPEWKATVAYREFS